MIACQPSQGDWIVTGEEVVENKTVVLDGNLIVKSGGNLTLRNVTLIVKSTYPRQYSISVEAEGSLSIYNSTIMPDDERYPPVFIVTRAKFVMKHSEVRGVARSYDPWHVLGSTFRIC
jgi:hypothetical protein